VSGAWLERCDSAASYESVSAALFARNVLRVRVAAGEQPVTLAELHAAGDALTASVAELAAELTARDGSARRGNEPYREWTRQ
jgi:hypothetical protein